MKKLLLLLIMITTLANVGYASFPVTEVEPVYDVSDSPISKRGRPIDDNGRVLLLTLVSLLGSLLGFILIAAYAYWLGGSVVTISLLSLLYSFYLNFTINIIFWDWRNYLCAIIALLFLIPILFAIAMSTS